jgi:hypothetical protein
MLRGAGSHLLSLQEGCFDPSGTYLEYERDELRDAYLESVEGEGRSR